ncbi:MAG: ATP-binding protein, partial [Burkholderiales bacterium]
LYLVPSELGEVPDPDANADEAADDPLEGVLGRDLAPVLRQPIARIIANAETIRTRLAGPLADDYAGYAADIADAARHLQGLVEDLADLDAIEAADFTLASERIDLADAARRAAGILGARARERGMTVVAPGEGETRPATGEARRVLQVLLNLLGNAIKFTDAGGVTLSVQAVQSKDGQVDLSMSVKDTGIGISARDRARIFVPFEQAEAGQQRESGAGLGLAISRELARLMGGEIEMESSPGGGSRFRFAVSLPVVREQQTVAPVHERILGYLGRRRSILVADDQEDNRRLLRQILEPLGFEVVVAGGGHEAVARAQLRRVDLVVMDLRMPGIDGLEAARL